MAHYTRHRRNLAAPEPKAPIQPTLKKHHLPRHGLTINPALGAKDADPTSTSSKTFRMPNTNTFSSGLHAASTRKAKTASAVDTLLQAKSFSSSADFDSSTKFGSSAKNGREMGKMGIKKTKEECEVKLKRSPKEMGDGKKSRANDKEKEKSKAGFRDGIDVDKFSSLSLVEKEMRKSHEGVALDGGSRKSTSSSGFSGRRRRSFGGVQVELGDVFASNGVRVVAVDMPPFMQIHAVDCARKAFDSLEKFSSKALAFTLKKEFDGVYGPAWHCIVGTSFGSFVTHSVGGFIYFSMDQKMYILLFKTTVSRVD